LAAGGGDGLFRQRQGRRTLWRRESRSGRQAPRQVIGDLRMLGGQLVGLTQSANGAGRVALRVQYRPGVKVRLYRAGIKSQGRSKV